MEVAKIVQPGFFTTVQDLGRFGFRNYGVPVSGAMDKWAFVTANLLVGNNYGSACLETTISGPAILFLKDCIAAVTGAETEVMVSGKSVPMWESIFCQAGETLSIGYPIQGCRNYIAFSGGINVPEVLGSRSTFVPGGFGGFNGRTLKKGDILSTIGPGSQVHIGLRYPVKYRPVYGKDFHVKIIKGINSDLFSPEEYGKLFDKPFKVTGRLDRMGCSLEGSAKIFSGTAADKGSFPVVSGSIQVLPSGNLIVLLNDAQSTGGYPQIATVISSELWKFGQAVPGNIIFFEETDIFYAQKLHEKKLRYLNTLETTTEGRYFFKTSKNSYEIVVCQKK